MVSGNKVCIGYVNQLHPVERRIDPTQEASIKKLTNQDLINIANDFKEGL